MGLQGTQFGKGRAHPGTRAMGVQASVPPPEQPLAPTPTGCGPACVTAAWSPRSWPGRGGKSSRAPSCRACGMSSSSVSLGVGGGPTQPTGAFREEREGSPAPHCGGHPRPLCTDKWCQPSADGGSPLFTQAGGLPTLQGPGPPVLPVRMSPYPLGVLQGQAWYWGPPHFSQSQGGAVYSTAAHPPLMQHLWAPALGQAWGQVLEPQLGTGGTHLVL